MSSRTPTIATRPLVAALCLLASLAVAAPAHAEVSCSQTIQGDDAFADVRCEATDLDGRPLASACLQLLAPSNNTTYLFTNNVSVLGAGILYSTPSC